MGSLDGAETCEIVGLFILNLLKSEINQDNLVLYLDSGLAMIKNANGYTLHNLRKIIIRIFKNEGLKIIIQLETKLFFHRIPRRNPRPKKQQIPPDLPKH